METYAFKGSFPTCLQVILLYRAFGPSCGDRVSLGYRGGRCRTGPKPCGEMLEELLHLPALTRRKYWYTCLKSLRGFLIFPHLIGNHGGSDNRSEEQPNKLPQGSKLAESRPYHDLRNRRYSLVRSTLRIRHGLGKKDAPGPDNIRVELQVTLASPFQDDIVMHVQYDEQRGADTKEEDRKSGHQNEASRVPVRWLGYHLLGYKTNDNIPHPQTSYHSRHVTAKTTHFRHLWDHLSY